MSNKQIIKQVFEEEFNKEKMKRQIILKYERKEKGKVLKTLKYGLAVCVIAITCGMLIYENNLQQSPKSNIENRSVNMTINKIEKIGATKLDASTKEISSKDIYNTDLDTLKDRITIPKDLSQFERYGLYTRKDKESEYDILNCYVYEYYKEDEIRNIRISFSKEFQPARDYHFSKEDAKKSNINKNELTIYQYEEIYFVEFQYNGYNFDIETSHITMEELTTLLTSIII